MVSHSRRHTFTAPLQRTDGKGGWYYVTVPPHLTPRDTGAWGRLPIRAWLDDVAWTTSLWRTKRGDGFLPVPKRIRGERAVGTILRVAFETDDDPDAFGSSPPNVVGGVATPSRG